MEQIIECIPNFSEGVNESTLSKIAFAIESCEGVKLLHQDSGKAANRTVFTFAGEPKAVFEASYKAIKIASNLIDMTTQKGEHPRIGACDVCPFVPIKGIGLSELIPMVNEFAKKVSSELGIPIFLYEESATNENRRNLAKHRVGGYEALEKRINSKKWLPDFGSFNAKSGGIVIGARNFLVAYNVNLNTKDSAIAQEIAYNLRELGRPIVKENGKTIYKPRLLKNVKAIGWYIKDFDIAQVSINLTDYNKTSLYEVYDNAQKIAAHYNVKVTGSELIGLIPLNALVNAGKAFLKNVKATEQEYIQSAIIGLGLSELSPFSPKKRILEYALSN